jgi:hypothetical protein
MKIKFGSIVVAGSGKIGGHVAARNRAGAYMRTKVTPVNPNTSFQAAVRNVLSALSTGWGALTPGQRTEWNGAVDSFKSTDVFGDIKRPSGFNLYVALNTNLLKIGEAAISVPPLPQNLPVIETGVLAAANGGAMTVTFTNDPVITDSEIEVFATPAVSPGKSFIKSELRFIGLMPAIAAHVTTLTTLYNAKFGAIGATGEKVFVSLKQVSKTSGQAGIPVQYSAIIT